VLGAIGRGFVTSRGDGAAKIRPVSQRADRDAALVPVVKELHQANYGVYGGARCGMLWLEFRPAVGMTPISLDEPVAGTCRLLQCEEIAIKKLQDVRLRAIVE